ncbi:bifunctional Phosphopantetheine adenylyltransferase - Dephospho-CoA kinase [Haematobia irritans]|uniref:bifunctional Phosphopantetheine adenylyltransferase - Dephospho-CoA kinase n=1 Tax=Haematobia irritans TaxID=7368 RepID=UPI003F4FA5B6
MATTGLLVISHVKRFAQSLKALQKYQYLKSLYVHLNVPITTSVTAPSYGRLISQLYIDSSSHFNNKDFNILVGTLKSHNVRLNLKPIDIIFSDAHHPEICEQFRQSLEIEKPTVYLHNDICNINDLAEYQQLEPEEKIRSYDNVVLGGTFDRIHLGHKIFLSQAVIRCRSRLVVGVTTSNLTKSKTLHELILPVEQRIDGVLEFLREIDPTLHYEVVPIEDAFGPTKSDPNMDMIIVSAETMKGGEKVNELRKQNNLNKLEIFCIDLVEASDSSGPRESKVSSSNTRIDVLGSRLRKPESKPFLSPEPYLIGLTGGIASGKSKMAKRLQDMGAFVIDCDKVAHEIYEPGQICYTKILAEFGDKILDDNKCIDRTKLGPIVFADSGRLEKLNNIVWPELMAEVKRRIKSLEKKVNPPKVVVLEAAVLIKAGWDKEVHEVWSMIVPPEEAIRRVVDRNGLSEEEAKRRLASQPSNSEIVSKSHVVFSSQWDSNFTQTQAEKAWQMLMDELKLSSTTTSNL